MKNIKTCVVGLALSSLLLSGCHQNPMTKGEAFEAFVKELGRGQRGDKEYCFRFYTEAKEDAQGSTLCGLITESIRDYLLREGKIPDSVTLKDLRDPVLWEQAEEILNKQDPQ